MSNQIYNPNPTPKTISIADVIQSARVFEKDGYVHIDYKTTSSYNGKRKRYSTGEKSSKRALARFNRDKYQLALNHYLENQTPATESLLFQDIGLKAIQEDRGNRQSDVQSDYIGIYHRFIEPHFKSMVLVDIKVRDIKAWKNNLLERYKLSKSRYAKYHRVLNFIFKYAFENELISKNPMDLVDKTSKLFVKPLNKDSNYYTRAEAKKIMDSATGWFKVFITTLFNTGIRTGEALALKWSDIDYEHNQITIQRSIRKGVIKHTTKTGIDRKIDLNKPLKKLLANYQATQEPASVWLFPNVNTCQPYCEPKSIIRYQLKPLLAKLGIQYRTLYATRHTFATSAVENSIPLTYIQRQLGHKKLSTTTDYYIKNGLLGSEGREHRADNLYAS
jgi:integrase